MMCVMFDNRNLALWFCFQCLPDSDVSTELNKLAAEKVALVGRLVITTKHNVRFVNFT